jgi:hypothetical protein
VKDVLHFSVSVPFSAWAAINRDLEIRHLIVKGAKSGPFWLLEPAAGPKVGTASRLLLAGGS